MSAENQDSLLHIKNVDVGSLPLTGQTDRYPEDHDLYGYVTSAGIERAEASGMWVNISGRLVWNACGDERPIDEKSELDLMRQAQDLLGIDEEAVATYVLPPSRGVISNFGNVAGAAQNVMAVGIMYQGSDFYEHVRGMEGFTDTLGKLMLIDAREAAKQGETALIPSLHTATKNERTVAERLGLHMEASGTGLFVPIGSDPTGCARNELLGKVSDLTAKDEDLRSQGQNDLAYLSGGTATKAADIADGHGKLAGIIGKDYSFGRDKYINTGLPVLALQRDSHLSVDQTAVLVNYDLDQAEKKGAYYTMGLPRVVYSVRRALREMDITLPAKDLMTSFILAATTTRSALAGGDPRQLPIGFRGGSMESALEDMARLERNARS